MRSCYWCFYCHCIKSNNIITETKESMTTKNISFCKLWITQFDRVTLFLKILFYYYFVWLFLFGHIICLECPQFVSIHKLYNKIIIFLHNKFSSSFFLVFFGNYFIVFYAFGRFLYHTITLHRSPWVISWTPWICLPTCITHTPTWCW